MFDNFPSGKYQVIYADPPWQYKTKECLAPNSCINGINNTHYESLTFEQLSSLPIKDISDTNCILFMWVVSPMLDECIQMMKTWGFKYSTVAFVWYKHVSNTGHYTLPECELCIVGKKGKIPSPRGARNVRQFISHRREEHSKKPDQVRDMISEMFPTQVKIELFARSKREGWECWGNEV